MGLVEAILEGSSLVREVKEKAAKEAREAGRAEGLERGRTAEARRSLRVALKIRFPGSDEMPEIDAISVVEELESLFETAITSMERAVVERAIAAAAHRPPSSV